MYDCSLSSTSCPRLSPSADILEKSLLSRYKVIIEQSLAPLLQYRSNEHNSSQSSRPPPLAKPLHQTIRAIQGWKTGMEDRDGRQGWKKELLPDCYARPARYSAILNDDDLRPTARPPSTPPPLPARPLPGLRLHAHPYIGQGQPSEFECGEPNSFWYGRLTVTGIERSCYAAIGR